MYYYLAIWTSYSTFKIIEVLWICLLSQIIRTAIQAIWISRICINQSKLILLTTILLTGVIIHYKIIFLFAFNAINLILFKFTLRAGGMTQTMSRVLTSSSWTIFYANCNQLSLNKNYLIWLINKNATNSLKSKIYLILCN